MKPISLIQYPTQNLRFTGFVEDIIGAYSGSNLLFTPSFGETFGLTIIEADACNLPVLARNLEVFTDLFGKNISYANNIEKFSEIIIEKPKKTNGTLAKNYDLDRIAKDAITLYDKIIDSKK